MKKYIVIEQSENYDYLNQVKYFDNFDEAKQYFIEAVDMYQLNSTIGEIKILKEWKKN